MFSSHKHLKRKTPAEGIDRREYIGHLVDEYYTSTNVEALEQVTANLANFAYDPINWQYLHEAEALHVFVASIETHNPNLQLHAIAALCNFCMDKDAAAFVIDKIDAIRLLFLQTEHSEIVLHSLALIYQLLSATLADKTLLITPELLRRVQHWRQQSNDGRVANLCQIFLEDFGSRCELTELNSKNAVTTPPVQQPKESAADSTDKTLHTEGS